MSVVYMRMATKEDLASILTIIEKARASLAKNNIPQWQNGDGPNKAVLQADIQNKQSYVLIAANLVIGVATISTGPEAAYDDLKSGNWLIADSPYVAIHRVAVDPDYQGKGYAFMLLSFLITAARLRNYVDIRIDTHPKNQVMQYVIKKVGFEHRGTIQLAVANGERFAYQLLLT